MYGHVACMREIKSGNPDWKRTLGKPRHRSEVNIRWILIKDDTRVVQDRVWWRTFVNTVMHFYIL